MGRLDLSQRSVVERRLVGALRSAIIAHGPITAETAPSAAKRMIGELKALAREQNLGKEESEEDSNSFRT